MQEKTKKALHIVVYPLTFKTKLFVLLGSDGSDCSVVPLDGE